MAWLLRRVTGLGFVLFLLTHVLDTALLRFGPTVHNPVVTIDFWPGAIRDTRPMICGGAVFFSLIMIPTRYVMLRLVSGHDRPSSVLITTHLSLLLPLVGGQAKTFELA